MPAGKHISTEIVSLKQPEQVAQLVADNLAPAMRRAGLSLVDHSSDGARFTRSYWPGGAVAGFLIGWILAAYSYSHAPTDLGGSKQIQLATIIAAAVGIGCLFIRRSEQLVFVFERHVKGTVIRITGAAPATTTRQLNSLRDDTMTVDQLGPLAGAAPILAPVETDPVARLAVLTDLRDRGALTAAEFQDQKAKILEAR